MRYVSSLHTYAYSVIALQQLNLAYKFPIIFWNTANLIVDSSGEEEEEEFILANELTLELDADEDDEETEDENEEKTTSKTDSEKKKNKTVNYGKISSAIGKMQQKGINVTLPDINKSKYTFTPDVPNDKILYGIKGITRVGDNLVKEIIENRPYVSLQDFLRKVKVNKLQIVNLIKAGAFDNLEQKTRQAILYEYLESVSDVKKDCNLRNMQMLINQKLIPEEYEFYQKLFNFNKYLKKAKAGSFYLLDEIAFKFYEVHYNVDLLTIENNKVYIDQKVWDKIYTKGMDPMRAFLKQNKEEMLRKMNSNLVEELVEKYAEGSLAKWEMSSLGFYHTEHELAAVDFKKYDIRNFFEQSEEPEVETVFFPKGREKPVPIFKIYRICGTVIHKDKIKHIVTLLTTNGVVNIKVWQAQFTKYDKQISEKLPNGKKRIVEKSWFSRGNKLMVTGFRRGDDFIPKIYSKSIYQHPFELIDTIEEDGSIVTIVGRGD